MRNSGRLQTPNIPTKIKELNPFSDYKRSRDTYIEDETGKKKSLFSADTTKSL